MDWKVVKRTPQSLDAKSDLHAWAFDLMLQSGEYSLSVRIPEETDVRLGPFSVGTSCRLEECPVGRDLSLHSNLVYTLPGKIPFLILKLP